MLRRNFSFQDPVRPWLVPDSLAPPELREELAAHCGGAVTPLPLPDRAEGYVFRDFARLEIEVDDRLAAQDPFPTLGRKVTDADFRTFPETKNSEACGNQHYDDCLLFTRNYSDGIPYWPQISGAPDQSFMVPVIKTHIGKQYR